MGSSIKTLFPEYFPAIEKLSRPDAKDDYSEVAEWFFNESGFELLDDKNSQIIEKIKALLIDLIQNKNNDINIKLSAYLIDHLHTDYSKISNLFSEIEGISIEKFFIHLRIEKVKELIFYDELSLSEIANALHFSSVAHLSNQFKKVTGFSPSYFKTLKNNKRIQLDHL